MHLRHLSYRASHPAHLNGAPNPDASLRSRKPPTQSLFIIKCWTPPVIYYVYCFQKIIS